ncbi:plasma protease C1 inhibitor [Melanotaenia boesemani]|uniref:plasma protease C1 inhibitor n=1 Tax=Melanotaenia boesemani TaxID=1250792 RepID=UPI001C05D0E6|nr:plasma protease C1 inhibitor [Melanotaenia boesemani]
MRQQATVFLLLQLMFELSSCTLIRMISGSAVELPCFPSQTDFTGEDITWKFNGNEISPTALSSGSAKIIKNGLYLSISPVTFASQGEYMCLAKWNENEVIRRYNITVDGLFSYTVVATEGSTVNLPCYFPSSNQVMANALWFKETGASQRSQLKLEDDFTGDKKLDLLYPMDNDQTIILRRVVVEDAGVYSCESAEGQILSTGYLIVAAAPASPPLLCNDTSKEWEPCQDENSRTAETVLQESLTEFSMKVYSHLREINPSSNLLFSPISISGVLSHLLLGARNETRRAIERAVSVPHDFHCVHVQMKKLREKMSHSLQMASQMYYNPELNLSKYFTNQSIQYYEAEPTKLLESSDENAQMINSWVANKTKNKITHLVDSVPTSTQLILLNAVSFSGEWKFKFEIKSRKGYFTKLDGDLVSVPILYHEKYMAVVMHSVELKAQVAKFALTGDSSLYILLPLNNKATALQQVEEKMTDTAVRQMIQQMKAVNSHPTEVTLPKITLDDEPNINILMKKLGLSLLFEGASLCGLYTEQRVVLDDARHKAVLVLTKQGVEAAAATSLSFSRSYPSFSALRPFVLLLWNDRANVPMFVGRVTDP